VLLTRLELLLAFVTEYVRELAAIENIRASGERELQQDPKASPFPNIIHTSTLFQLELRSQITMLQAMKLNSPADQLVPGITKTYERKIALWQRMTEIATEFMAGPRDGVDYGKLAAELPQIRAELDYIDQALFEISPAVFATLLGARFQSAWRNALSINWAQLQQHLRAFYCRTDEQKGRFATRLSVPQHFGSQRRYLQLGLRHEPKTSRSARSGNYLLCPDSSRPEELLGQ